MPKERRKDLVEMPATFVAREATMKIVVLCGCRSSEKLADIRMMSAWVHFRSWKGNPNGAFSVSL